ncbi:hypothetical protein LX36DRAFT_370624 [Colletotrichum falcatum]|nr:hypothetical protein LX36DRAFT_370624 [Colletotrichum falcatum]
MINTSYTLLYKGTKASSCVALRAAVEESLLAACLAHLTGDSEEVLRPLKCGDRGCFGSATGAILDQKHCLHDEFASKTHPGVFISSSSRIRCLIDHGGGASTAQEARIRAYAYFYRGLCPSKAPPPRLANYSYASHFRYRQSEPLARNILELTHKALCIMQYVIGAWLVLWLHGTSKLVWSQGRA